MKDEPKDKYSLCVLWAVAVFMFVLGSLGGGTGVVGVLFLAKYLCSQ